MAKSAKIYSKLDYESAIEIKKNILSTQINLLNITQDINDFKKLRKKEATDKIKLQKNLQEMKKLLKQEVDKAPKATKAKLKKPEKQQAKETDQEYLDIQSQLHDIKEKLSHLSE
ncbi:MAG: hypothetical protein ABIH59_01700 [archaeon]